MRKIDIGTIIALIIAVSSGIFWLGKLDQRVANMEENTGSVKEDIIQERDKAIEQINQKLAEINNISRGDNDTVRQTDLKKKEILNDIKAERDEAIEQINQKIGELKESQDTANGILDYSACVYKQVSNPTGEHTTYCPEGYVVVGGRTDGNDWIWETIVCCKLEGIKTKKWESKPSRPY